MNITNKKKIKPDFLLIKNVKNRPTIGKISIAKDKKELSCIKNIMLYNIDQNIKFLKSKLIIFEYMNIN
jgi:hypothetical protein